MAYVNMTGSVRVKIINDGAGEFAASYIHGDRKAELILTVDGLSATIEVDAEELDELIAGLRKVRDAMGEDD